MSRGVQNEQETKASATRALARLAAGEKAPLARWLRTHLFEHILPFWEQQAFDPHGGICTCVGVKGEVLSHDKWMWSQWRAVWVYARLYNRIDREERWLNHARHIAEFCLRHAWDSAGDGWALVVSREGKILRGNESIYSDSFAIYGLLELYLATGDDELRRVACWTADAALRKLSRPYDTIPHVPYPIPPGTKPHGIPMIWSLTLAELGKALNREDYLRAAAAFADEIFRDFYRRDRDVILEFVRQDGREYDPPQGLAINPGHAIEDMWFQVHVALILGNGAARIAEAFRLTLRHLDLGWDGSHGGGLRLAVDANQSETVGWGFAETKLWWPHTEALYTTLLGWCQTGRREFFDWYERIWQLCLAHYVDWENGEWRQRLRRDFTPLSEFVAFPVKDPFHLPRSLILQIELLENRGLVQRP